MEFLGDAVIDLVISHRLMERCPDSREGELSKLRAALVNEDGLSRIACSLGLGDLLLLGRGEEATGGRRQRASVLANALEAVIGAFTRCGLGGGVAFRRSCLRLAIERRSLVARPRLQDGDPGARPGALQDAPRYRVVTQTGPDHERVFSIELTVNGIPFGEGTGRSKKEAEQARPASPIPNCWSSEPLGLSNLLR